jgi:hypothetical protein
MGHDHIVALSKPLSASAKERVEKVVLASATESNNSLNQRDNDAANNVSAGWTEVKRARRVKKVLSDKKVDKVSTKFKTSDANVNAAIKQVAHSLI